MVGQPGGFFASACRGTEKPMAKQVISGYIAERFAAPYLLPAEVLLAVS